MSGPSQRLVSLVVVRAIVRAASAAGCNATELVSRAGLTESDLAPADEFVPSELEELLWVEACRQVRERDFGLRAASTLRRGDFRALEYLCRTSSDLGRALELLVRFQGFLHGSPLFELRPANDALLLEYRPPFAPSFAHAHIVGEFALAALVVLGRDATGSDWTPQRVRLTGSCPPNREPYAQLFRCPVDFGAKRCELLLAQEALLSPMRAADQVLCSILAACVERTIALLGSVESPLVQSVRQAVVRSLSRGDTSIDAVAQMLHMGRRTLQKRLATEATSYQQTLDEARRALAREYLARPDLSVPGIAMLLGYSDVTAFHRAFRRWTGQTPGAFRRALRGAVGHRL